MSSTPRERILTLLGEHDALSFDELYKRIDEIESKQALSALLCAMKKAGEVAQAAPRQPYTLPGKHARAAPASCRRVDKPLRQPKDRRALRLPPAPRNADPTRAVLERNAVATQKALDEYLAAVADPHILGPLRVSRDGARTALAAFDRQQEAAAP